MRSCSLVLVVASMVACGRPSPSGVSLDRSIREPSGVTKSSTHDGVFWVHGDSGTGNWLYAVDRDGKLLTSLRVKGAKNVDWEDITHDDRGNLWLGDIGNNDSNRRDLVVYRIPEPDPHAESDQVRIEARVAVSYPEQTEYGDKLLDFDAESLLWWDGQLWLLTKHRSDDRTWLYRFPALDQDSVALERIAGFDLGPTLEDSGKSWAGQVTGAEVAPSGRHWALLSYDAVFVFELPKPGEPEQMFAKLVTRIGFDQDEIAQVESVTWDGAELVLINEERHVFRIGDPLTATVFP